MSALLLMLLTMLQLSVDGTAAVAVVLDVKLMSVWAQVHEQVLMCMPVCVIGTDDSGDKFMKNIFVGRSAA